MKFLMLIPVLIFSASAFAGGTLPTEEALAVVCKEDKNICRALKSMPLEPVASGLRDREGFRHLPFEFLTEDGVTLLEVDRGENGRLTLKMGPVDDGKVEVDPSL